MAEIDQKAWSEAGALTRKSKILREMICDLSLLEQFCVVLGMLCECLHETPPKHRREVAEAFTARIEMFLAEIEAERGLVP